MRGVDKGHWLIYRTSEGVESLGLKKNEDQDVSGLEDSHFKVVPLEWSGTDVLGVCNILFKIQNPERNDWFGFCLFEEGEDQKRGK